MGGKQSPSELTKGEQSPSPSRARHTADPVRGKQSKLVPVGERAVREARRVKFSTYKQELKKIHANHVKYGKKCKADNETALLMEAKKKAEIAAFAQGWDQAIMKVQEDAKQARKKASTN